MRSKFTQILTLLLAFIVQFSFAQEKTITGNVTAEDGLPLPGVNIVVKGTNTGTQTDFDGNYSITASEGQVLMFTYLGMEVSEYTVGASSTIDVKMVESAESLEEVVVLGYVSKRREDVTGSVVQVDSETITQTTATSVDQALQGKVAGLSINMGSGTPGSASNVRIRGRSSVTADNEPLYVIDGVPVINDNVSGADSGSSLNALASLNANDIESMTVLKDASATAQYGARGANGVIVITTKSGKAGKTTFNVSTSYGFSNDAIKGPRVLTGAEREMLYYEAIYNDYGEANGFTRDQARGFYEDNVATFGSTYVDWNNAGRPETDWAKIITNRNAPIQQHNISATGGDETHNFYASIGYYSQDATVINSDFERISGALNFAKTFNDKLSFRTSNTVSHTYQNGLLEGSAYFSSPRTVKFFTPSTVQPYNKDGSYNLDTPMPNPLWISDNDIDDNRLTRILTNNSLTWQTPIENLGFTTKVAIDYQVTNYKRYRNRISGDGDATNGYGFQSHNSSTSYVFQNSLNYVIPLDRHNIDLTVLQEFQKNRRYFLSGEANEFGTDGLTNLNTAGTPTDVNSLFEDWMVASYMGMVSYSFDSRYVLNGTYRAEGNSRFSSKNRWGNFWSIGGAWNLHREDFMANADAINMLKLRASYGVTGNAGIELNQYQVLFGYSGDYDGSAAASPDTYGNEDLTWETSHTLDLGLDFAFFQNRLNGAFSYYNRESKDLLLDVPLSRTTGFASQTRNIGRMENKGLEFELDYTIVRSDDFNLSIGGNIASNQNKMLELAKDANGDDINIVTTQQRVEVGHPAYGWNLPTWAGVDPDTGVDTWYINGVDGETTSNFNEAERAWQGGSALPKLTAGLNIHVDYKGFFLDASGFYQGGNKVYESWHLYTHQGNGYSLSSFQGINTVLDRWQQPGDVTRHAKVTTGFQPWQYNSKFLFDGDFMRLRNLTVGYDFSKPIVDAMGISGARVYVRGTNLLTWVKDKDLVWDPEVDEEGFTDMNTPAVKTVVVGFNFNF